MEPWYESSGPSETEVVDGMLRSEIYRCLHAEANIEDDNIFLRQTVMAILNRNCDGDSTLNGGSANMHIKNITYESIRRHPDWRIISMTILHEEVCAHKPYGSYRGFHTFISTPLNEKCIIRIIREIWAPYVIQTKLAPKWRTYHSMYITPRQWGRCDVRTDDNETTTRRI